MMVGIFFFDVVMESSDILEIRKMFKMYLSLEKIMKKVNI